MSTLDHVVESLGRAVVVVRVRLAVLLIVLYCLLISALDSQWNFLRDVDVDTSLLPTGVLLGLFLAYRTNVAYDRWWEGRKLWGQLVNESRNLALKIRSLRGLESGDRRMMLDLITAFPVALAQHLRDGGRLRDLEAFRLSAEDPKHVPAFLAGRIIERIQSWKRDGRIDSFEFLILDPHAKSLMDVCGACERIRKTLPPPSHRALCRQLILIYLVLLPWQVFDECGWWTFLWAGVSCYFFVGVEAIAEDLEEPFGCQDDDLRLEDITATIRRSVREILESAAEREPEETVLPDALSTPEGPSSDCAAETD